ncbi:MAG TPA: tRNA (adenosine(37)-N6)-threonylcarbamoyltransferase complex ATPase subunit type 1 TsaE [Candidatus Kapabacteria bacterium]|jgi:tRNA threonylcarbamoyladenosine biosynthesis protein TsaE|nr:tRNA (adenosine(37)-N6)-threonylcarbamoyltransferase complex ATPase subunit type 1 TsaE [Candidatus Kapabacteria bacterium]HOV91984.1 tRNA (adenosine(37)-N6)-threonylcarbamoyltransferase complex ATPase subunit type 1 TsaE [Candidatus Kapabacteria bacterium]
MEFNSTSESDTYNIGKKLATYLVPGDIVAFYGDLGSGKTAIIKGFCDYFDVDEIVVSPTFTIINKYEGKEKNIPITIYHIDLYRIESDKELQEIGFSEYLNDPSAIKLIEWADRTKLIDDSAIKITIKTDRTNDNYRKILVDNLDEILNEA